VVEPAITDAELTALALAADPHEAPGPDAVPLDVYLSRNQEPAAVLLPAWYMAPVRARRARWTVQLIALALIGAFLLIEAVGLCSTYGQPPFH
jgi:hypothetical protein